MTLLSCKDGDFDPNANAILLTGTDVTPVVVFPVDDTPSTYYVTSSTSRKVDEDVLVSYEINNGAIDVYNERNKMNFYPAPEGSIKLLDTQDVIESGKAASTGVRVQLVSTEDFVDGRTYIVPISIKSVEGGNLKVLVPSETILLRISRKISFNSLDVGNANLYSTYDWWRSEGKSAIPLPRYTCEVKVFLTEDKPNRIRRLCNWAGDHGADADGNSAGAQSGGKNQNMLRFGEEGTDRNILQWVSPGGGVFSKTSFAPNRWYTVSLTYNGSSFIMYVDGVKDAELGGTGDFAFSSFELGMSWAGYTSSQMTRGRIAEVRLWNKALVASEIQMGLCGIDPNSDGLIAYWKMNEGEGHIFHDSSPSGMHMDWSDTWRSPSENDRYSQYNKSSYVNWVIDSNNTCNQ